MSALWGFLTGLVAVQWHAPTFIIGQSYANQLRRGRPRPGDKWHLDEVFLTINGQRHHLWRAVDQDGHVLDILVQRRRDKAAARPSGSSCRVWHRQHRYLNHRAENSHQPTRQRERRMQQFNSPGHAQRFLAPMGPSHHISAHDAIAFLPTYRQEMRQCLQTWRGVTSTAMAA